MLFQPFNMLLQKHRIELAAEFKYQAIHQNNELYL